MYLCLYDRSELQRLNLLTYFDQDYTKHVIWINIWTREIYYFKRLKIDPDFGQKKPHSQYYFNALQKKAPTITEKYFVLKIGIGVLLDMV